MADFPEVAHRRIGERQRVQVARRAELWRQRRSFFAALFLRVPDDPPPAFVGGEVHGVFGCAGIRHLRALFVTDACVQVQTTRGTLPDDVKLVVNETFGDTD